MGDDRILDLVEETIESGKPPEEVCAHCPELLPEVRRRLSEYRVLQDHLEVYLPVPSGPDLEAPPAPSMVFPDVPGYEIRAALGTGGMGVVYLGRHLKLRRDVAIKMLLAGPYAGAVERERFLREARALATLRHPNIVSVYDVGESQGRPYFTMEHMEGGTLAQELAGEPLRPDEAVRSALTLAEAVAHAHHHGIIHRDLKPSNILRGRDGALKISDFGIARLSQGDQTLTLAGARMGTPSYMAPEQAIGTPAEIGPGADVYSLGAVLYELLTGRPPFRGSTAAETERQLIHEEPAPPRLLNAGVSRDVETVCLKCLQKSPARRYPSASDLAEDLRRLLAGEPIIARPVAPLERGVKWVRRRPGAASATAAGIVLFLALAGAAIWASSSRAATIGAVTADLTQAAQHQRSGEWGQARAAIERAKVRLGQRGLGTLRRRVARSEADLDLVDRLDAARILHAGTVSGVLNNRPAAEAYAHAFRDSGLGSPDEAAEVVAERVRSSPIARVLIGALDDWATCVEDERQRRWLIETTQLADHDDDPSQWRRRARSFLGTAESEALAGLAAEARAAEQPLPFLYSFGLTLQRAKVDCLPYLRLAQRAYPSDFWITALLANTLQTQGRIDEAIEYHRAAVSVRPDTMVTHFNLGTALGEAGRTDEAIESFLEAGRLDPNAANPVKSLGLALRISGRHEEALETLLKAHALDPSDPSLMGLIALCLAQNGRYPEAVDWHRRAVLAGLDVSRDRWRLRTHLLAHSQHAFARSVWEVNLAAASDGISDWDGYAELCLFVDDREEYERTRAILLDRFSDLENPNWCERTARACLLVAPTSPGDLGRVSALIDRAIASQAGNRTWEYPYFRLAHALAAYRSGDFEMTLAIAEGESAKVLPPLPRLLAAMARERLGQHDLALGHLAAASLTMDWTVARAIPREAWMCHALRREAEQLIVHDLAGLISGDIVPETEDLRLAVLGACQASQRFGRWAQLWEESSRRAGSTTSEMPGHAICTLVLAAAGAGVDAGRYTDEDRDRWRHLALAELGDQIDAWERTAQDAHDPARAKAARQAVAAWGSVPELASVRDADQLVRLPESQRQQWLALWRRVDAAADPSVSERK